MDSLFNVALSVKRVSAVCDDGVSEFLGWERSAVLVKCIHPQKVCFLPCHLCELVRRFGFEKGTRVLKAPGSLGLRKQGIASSASHLRGGDMVKLKTYRLLV